MFPSFYDSIAEAAYPVSPRSDFAIPEPRPYPTLFLHSMQHPRRHTLEQDQGFFRPLEGRGYVLGMWNLVALPVNWADGFVYSTL